MLLIATRHLPADVAAVLAMQNGQTVVALADWLTAGQIVQAENLVLDRGRLATVVLRDELK